MKKYTKIFIGVICVLALSCVICGCSSKSALVGNWVADEIINGYPDSMTLKSDGTGSLDGISCNWYTDGGEVTFSMAIGNYTYEYNVSGKTLFLDDYTYHKGDK